MTTGGGVFCPQCGAKNEPGGAYCESCGHPLNTAGGRSGTSRGRLALAVAIGAAAVLLLVGLGVVLAVTRGGDGGATEVFETTEVGADVFETTDVGAFTEVATTELTDTSDAPGSLTADEEELYSHIPAAVGTENCEVADGPEEALAGAVCELPAEDLVLEYYLLPDADSMYVVFDRYLDGHELVTEGGCPQDTEDWDFGDDIARGKWSCHLTSLAEGDDAHLMWTYDDLLILSIVSHIAVDATTASLVDFWTQSAGPE
jgi:hypothetical protein